MALIATFFNESKEKKWPNNAPYSFVQWYMILDFLLDAEREGLLGAYEPALYVHKQHYNFFLPFIVGLTNLLNGLTYLSRLLTGLRADSNTHCNLCPRPSSMCTTQYFLNDYIWSIFCAAFQISFFFCGDPFISSLKTFTLAFSSPFPH